MTVRGRTEWQKFVDDKLKDHDKRLSEQEKANAVYQALQEEQRKHLNDRFNRIQDNINQTKADLIEDVSTIKTGINKILIAVLVAIALAFVQFVIKGGLNI